MFRASTALAVCTIMAVLATTVRAQGNCALPWNCWGETDPIGSFMGANTTRALTVGNPHAGECAINPDTKKVGCNVKCCSSDAFKDGKWDLIDSLCYSIEPLCAPKPSGGSAAAGYVLGFLSFLLMLGEFQTYSLSPPTPPQHQAPSPMPDVPFDLQVVPSGRLGTLSGRR